MGMTAFYKAENLNEDEKIKSIGKALEMGINFLDLHAFTKTSRPANPTKF
jgi:hypothetical protein